MIKCFHFLEKYKLELMGVCILWIMLFHSSIQAPESTVLRIVWYICISFGGGFGVNIFLILSGFGISYSRLQRKTSGSVESWNAYFKRRFSRIMPAYLIVAIVFYFITCNSVSCFLYNISFMSFILGGG